MTRTDISVGGGAHSRVAHVAAPQAGWAAWTFASS
jgi:hypothetical protein